MRLERSEREKLDADQVRQHLQELSQESYREFQKKLIPGEDKILGVRIPALRAYAVKLAKMNWEEWFLKGEDIWMEETMLRGLVLAYGKMDPGKRLEYVTAFVPHIKNWAVCDTFCSSLKDAGKYQERYWDFLEPYCLSEDEFSARFGAVMLLSHFVKEAYLEKALVRLEQIHQEGYYCKMAVAWALSVYFAAFPERMLLYLQKNPSLDSFTYKKTLQKILESDRVEKEMKKSIRELRQRG